MLPVPIKSSYSIGLKQRRKLYLRVIWKFWISHAVSALWMGLSIWLSLPWVQELRHLFGLFFALVIIAGLAYIPGYLNAFLVMSLLFDRQPGLNVSNPSMPVTILIACRNEEQSIAATLRNVKKQDYRGEIQVIVIDNASTDRTQEAALAAGKELSLPVEVLYEPRPGKHRALNTALQHVLHPFVITLDADTLLHKSAVRYLVSRLISAPDDVCAVAGAVMVRNSRDNWWTRMQEWDYFLGIASIKRLQGLYQGTLVAQGAYSLYLTRVIREVGGWPDAIGEDIVLTWKFLERGWRVYFEPLAVAFTDVPTRFRHFARQRSRWARGMIEGLKTVRPWKQPQMYTKYLTMVNFLMPYTDLVFTCVWLPGLLLSCFGIFSIVGPTTLFVLPLTLLSNFILYRYQKNVFRALDLRIRKNYLGFFAYTFAYQLFMSPISVWGYVQELLLLKRVWK